MKTGLLRFLAISFSLFSFFVLSGCGPFWVDPYITVQDSQLNWVEIHYYNLASPSAEKARARARRVDVSICGTGLVEVKKGTSELVTNDFAKRYKDENWGDIKTRRLQISSQRATDIFQNLVNFGLLDREKTFKASKKKVQDRFIAVKANIDTNTYSDNVNIFEADPDLAEQLLDVVREFDSPIW